MKNSFSLQRWSRDNPAQEKKMEEPPMNLFKGALVPKSSVDRKEDQNITYHLADIGDAGLGGIPPLKDAQHANHDDTVTPDATNNNFNNCFLVDDDDSPPPVPPENRDNWTAQLGKVFFGKNPLAKSTKKKTRSGDIYWLFDYDSSCSHV
jgi:hypothetical protein